MCADIYTKAFSDRLKWQSVCALINVVDPKSFSQLVKSKAEMLREQSQEEQSSRPKAQKQDNTEIPFRSSQSFAPKRLLLRRSRDKKLEIRVFGVHRWDKKKQSSVSEVFCG